MRDPSLIQNMIFKKAHRAAVCFLTFLVLMNGAILPAKAGEKATVELQCSTTKVVLTCTMFDHGSCIRSTLTFDAGHGARTVLPTVKIPQDFDAPTIADDISCVTSNNKFAVAVTYSPGCPYDGCLVVRMYDLNGNSILTRENSTIPDYFGKGTTDFQIVVNESLRVDQ